MNTRYYIDNQTSVDTRFAIQIGDNGFSGDIGTTLNIAPSMEFPGIAIVYIRTSGGPSFVMSLNEENEIAFFNDSSAFSGTHFGCELLKEFGFEPDEDAHEFGAEEWIQERLVEAGIGV